MMRQYLEIKAANPDCLLFYRMGDFYELFFQDAEIASRALGIVLTKRGKHQGADIPMCGVPVVRSDEYLHRLIAAGLSRRGVRADRGPGRGQEARREERRAARRDAADHRRHADRRFAARCAAQQLSRRDRAREGASAPDAAALFALAALDISTAEFRVMECDRLALAAEIARIEPGEIIVSDALYGDTDIAPYLRELPVTPLTRDVFDGATAERRLASYFAVATTESFGRFSRLELTAAAACITYVERTQLGARPPLSPPTREAAGSSLMIDAATRANLELMRTLSGERRGSLIAAIDRTVTPAGARLLGQRLAAPLTDPDAIARRLDAVALFVADGDGAHRCARAAGRRAGSGALARAAGAPARRPARSCGHPRRARGRECIGGAAARAARSSG